MYAFLVFKATSLRLSVESKASYYRARYYDPNSGRFFSEDPLGADAGPNSYTFVGNAPANFVDPLGLYKLKGFDTAQSTKMKNALDEAIKKLKQCPSCAGDDGPKIANTLSHTTFVYVPDLRSPKFKIGDQEYGGDLACADAGESAAAKPTRVILIGGLAFKPGGCSCPLASMLAHEASHKPPTNYSHSQTDNLEEKCFGCKIHSAPTF
jgi:RHS repeat-associated protein